MRNESDFRAEQANQVILHQQEDEGKVNIYYFDGAGFSTQSSIPYGWQPVASTYEIPCKRSEGINILGFMSRKNQSHFHAVEGSVTSVEVITAFDQFATKYALEQLETQVPCLVILDNASVHHSKAVKARLNDWAKQGVALHFLPAYSPELNLIEILWRKIKYQWLPMTAYKDRPTMKETVLEILKSFGQKYTITFG